MALTGERITVDKTYAQMEALIAAEELNPFLWYKISDRGDRGLVFRAASTNRLESDGIRYMLCPATYAVGVDAYDNDWIGVWNATKQATAAEGQLCIWNGLVWVAGATMDGNAPDTETSGWTVIPKASFTNNEYVEMILGVTYDFNGDWIDKQWDNKGNIFGLSKYYYTISREIEGEPINPIDYCDWNSENNNYLFSLNKCSYCYNNSNAGLGIFSNVVSGDISGNSNNGTIYNNITKTISNNSNSGEIGGNYCGQIMNNSNIGNISGNSNNGGINNNTCDGSISNNKNFGPISTNSNNGGIYDNSNQGAISGNSNAGAINDNGNLDFILDNSNIGSIHYNLNNGEISNNSSGANPCVIHHNINNGSITGSWDADVTDTIVDKTGTA